MKKFITLFLVLTGYVCSANADYYVFYNQDGSYDDHLLATLTDTDGDGVYSADINLENASKLNWGVITFVLSRENTLGNQWANVLWSNLDSDTSLFDADEFTLGAWTSSDKEGKLQIPITEATPKTYALRMEFDSSTSKIKGTRLIEFASSNDDWHTSNPIYMPETAHNSGIFSKIMELPNETAFKFITNENGGTGWFGNKDGNTIAIDGGGNISINKDGVYTITANMSSYTYVAPTLVTVPAAVGTYGMATLCSEYALDFTGITNVKAYTITEAADGVLTPTQVTGKVKANTGLYLDGDVDASVNVPTTIYTTDPAGTNMLVGVTKDTPISQIDGDNTNFILTVNKDGGDVASPKFFKVNTAGNTVLAGKAYLQIPTESVGARESFWFNEETGVSVVKQEQALDGQAYNLAGQRVAQPQKGLYIVNGKKVIIK